MLELHLVEHLPHWKLVVVTGFVAHAVLIGEPAVHIPIDEAGVVVAQLLAGGVAPLSPLRIVPHHLVGIVGIGDRLIRLEDPGRNGAEVHHRGMTVGCGKKILGHGIDETEVPTGLLRGGRFQFGHRQPGIRQPELITHIIGAQIL